MEVRRGTVVVPVSDGAFFRTDRGGFSGLPRPELWQVFPFFWFFPYFWGVGPG